MFESLDIVCSRRVPLKYVAPDFCEQDFSSTGDPIVILNPINRRRGPTGLVLSSVGGRIILSWGTVDGAVCYNVYAVVGENYVLIAECIPDPNFDVTDFTGPYCVSVITADGESDLECTDSDTPIQPEPDPDPGPGEVCVLRIIGYGTPVQPIFNPPVAAPASSDVEWDGIWNILLGDGSPNEYWYRGANEQIFRPNIAIAGRAVAAITIVGPNDPSGPYLNQFWSMFVQYESESGPLVISKYWVGDKVGGDTTSPVGVYVNRDTFPEFGPPQNSDNRLSVEVEFCEF